MRAETVGVVGLGQMGGPIAGHMLDAGYAVVGYDIAAQRLETLVGKGGVAETSAAGVGRRCEIVLTSLPSGDAIREVLSGPEGLLGPGTATEIIVELSTLSLEDKQDARSAAAKEGVTLLDCPLSGTGAQAVTKDLAAYVSGDETAALRCDDVLSTFTRQRFHFGAFGNGSRAKYVANLLVTVHNVAAAEALLLATKAGLDPSLLLKALSSGAGSSRMLEVRGPKMIERDYTGPGIALRVYAKDIAVIGDFARSIDCPTPLFSAASALYVAGLAQGLDDADTAAVHAVLERMASRSP